MTNRKLIHPAFLLLCLFLSLNSTCFASSKIIAVHPGESIQQAIDRAKSGDIILVSAGIYYETIKLKQGIILRSNKNPEATIIDGQNSTVAVLEGADECLVEGFTITGKGPSAKESESSHAVECINTSFVIKNNIIKYNHGTGIYVKGEKAAPEIIGNKIYSNRGAGIGNEHNSRARIIDNECYNNTSAGIGIRHQAAPLLENNNCHHNEMAGIGIQHKNTFPILKNNRCHYNKLAGIGVEKEASPTLEDNRVYNNGRAGIGIRSGSNVILMGNTITENTLSGIGIMDKCTVIIDNNTVADNLMAGITVTDGSEADISNNAIRNNGTQGIVCSFSRVNISQNTISDNTHHGIAIYRRSKAEITKNTVYDNGANNRRGAGIIIVSSNDVVITYNNFYDNYGPGVYTRKSSPQIEYNEFTNDLVYVKDYASPTVAHNTFYSAKKVKGKKHKSGVDVRENSSPIVMDNKFYGIYGIAVRHKSRPLITGNVFSSRHKSSIKSGRSGVKVDKVSCPTISRNIFYNGNKVLAGGKSVTTNKTILQTKTRLRSMRDGNIPEEFKEFVLYITDNLFLD